MKSWIVTTRHLHPGHPEGRHPWGVQHARRPDGGKTACDLDTTGWRVFWHLAFGTYSAVACEDCSDAIDRLTGTSVANLLRAR